MKNKAFTLVELLAVIIVLGLLTTLVVTNIDKIVDRSENDIYKNQIYDILDSAYDFTLKYSNYLPDENNNVKYITLAHLINEGLIDSDIKNPKTNKIFEYSLVISINYVSNDYVNTNISKKWGNYLYKIEESKTNYYSYDFDSNFIDSTVPINGNYALVNIPQGAIRIITKNNKQVSEIDTSNPDVYEVTDVILGDNGNSTSKTIKVVVGLNND